MKLSEYRGLKLTNEDIDKIVFSDIDNDGKSCSYALVFGHIMLIKERTQKAVEMYKNGRAKKLVFLGGGWGDSNTSDNHIPESHQMGDLAKKLGVDSNDIIIEDKSTDTKSNILFAIEILNLNASDTIMLISSEFHLKRCNAIIKKKIPGIQTILVKAPDGIHDKNNWFLNDMVFYDNGKYGSGKTLVTREAYALIEGACAGELEDFDIADA